MSKAPQSGLRTVRREWSTSTGASPEIYLPQASTGSTAATQSHSTTSVPTAPLTDSQIRLKLIEQALAGGVSLAEPLKPLANSRILNKRKSDPESVPDPSAKKARQLPLGYRKNDVAPALPSPLSIRAAKPILRAALSSSSHISSSSKLSSSTSVPDPQLKQIAAVFLSTEQTHILNLVQGGESIFYTGSAGTGKSVLLREIIKMLRKKHAKNPDAVAITASTGIAACNIGGVTIHSFAGIGLGNDIADILATKVRKNRKAVTRWHRTKVLIIDEVSMVDGDLFDKLEKIATSVRKNQEPFGGIQVIVTGDFFQLPPVTRSGDVKFAFEAEMWNKVISRTFNLTRVFRQSDQVFVDMLNEMRFGKLSPESIRRFRSLSRPLTNDDGLEATELFPMRADVDRSNSGRMSRLTTEEEIFVANDSGSLADPKQKEKVLSNFMAPSKLVLRVEAQVMLTKNVDETLVNGTVGRIIRFVDPAVYSTELDIEAPPGFVGGVIGTGPTVGSAGSRKKSAATAPGKVYPIVEFATTIGRRPMLVLCETWKVELPNGEVQVSRTQLPLILSWAMSIHKSQGQTLERVKVDLAKVFEKGQAYVALSRATCLEGLQVLNFDPKKVMAHPKVADWCRTLEVVNPNS